MENKICPSCKEDKATLLNIQDDITSAAFVNNIKHKLYKTLSLKQFMIFEKIVEEFSMLKLIHQVTLSLKFLFLAVKDNASIRKNIL